MDDGSDDALVRRAADGEIAAWRALVDRHLAPLVAFAWHRLDDRTEAEDVAQETMLRLSRKAGDWQAGGAALRTWLFHVARNLCIDRLRARKPGVPLDDAIEAGDTAVVDFHTRLEDNLDTRRIVQRGLRALPERQREALILVYCLGCTLRETAGIMRISEHAAESLLARGRRSLRTVLGPHADGLRRERR